MRTQILLVAGILLFSINFAQASPKLMMVRSDDGASKFLASPEQMNLDAFNEQFDTSLDTIVLVHGFNNTPDSARGAYLEVKAVLEEGIGKHNFVGLYWPSNTGLDFGAGIHRADVAADFLASLLKVIEKQYNGADHRLHLVCHSLGGRVVLKTLSKEGIRHMAVKSAILMAPAVHSDAYTNEFAGTNAVPEHTWVYHSHDDIVLQLAYVLWYFLVSLDGFAESPQYEAWKKLDLEGQIDYLSDLVDKRDKDSAWQPDNDFDRHLLEKVAEAEKLKALGEIGAPGDMANTTSRDLTEIVDIHTYWTNWLVLGQIVKDLSSLK